MINEIDMSSMRRASVDETHSALLEIIKHIDKVCAKANIRYFAAFGTLIGAVREHGFIPWDDDADLFMLREDYERFCKVFNDYPDSRFFLDNVDTDEFFFLPFLSRVCMNNTIAGGGWNEHKFHTGLWVDIYPLDYCFTDIKETEKKYNRCKFLHTKIVYPRRQKFRHCRSIEGLLKLSVLKLFSTKLINKIYRKTITNNSPDKTSIVSFASTYGWEHSKFSASIFSETVYMPFEDMNMPCPAGYDELLKIIYGSDYMTPINRSFKTVYIKK
ncbi:MAG: LicD family protein [Synergistaceae bacterium]|nr:LicD family protein [Synergistaceae bacterium]